MKTNYQIDQINDIQIQNPEYWMSLIQQEGDFQMIITRDILKGMINGFEQLINQKSKEYYFEQQKWINEVYFKQRGLDDLGYTNTMSDFNLDDIELSGEIELDDNNSTTVIDFAGEHAEIDNRKDQKFEEI